MRRAAALLDVRAGGAGAGERLGVGAVAAVAAGGDAVRERDQFLGLPVERAVAGRGLGQRRERLHGVGNVGVLRSPEMRLQMSA